MAGNPGRSGAVMAITGARRTFGAASDAFLSVPRPETTARTYAGTMERLAALLGRDLPLASVTDDELESAANELWGSTAHLEPPRRHCPVVHVMLPRARVARRKPAPERRPAGGTRRPRCPSWSGCGATAASRCGSGR
ncbi:MAG TPA: hypothetical protein VHZ03_26400 [Trebonia sp.]|jgi:hypothetical protein|nr:hypothetical protein [Trebonia sp.]